MRVGAVDCGTNSIRLLVADVAGDRKTDVHREMRVVRLGQGVDRTGELAPEALERTRGALVDYAATCRELGTERVRMVATSATRDARNRDDFRAMVQDVLGVAPEVVSGDEEAALSFDGATRGLDPACGPFLVMDIGGGSTELVLGTSSREAGLSVDVGCVRLTERHLVDDPPTSAQVAAAQADVDAGIERVRAGGARRAGAHRGRTGRLGHDGGRARPRAPGVRPRAHPPVAHPGCRRRAPWPRACWR